jgi:hypothetical protein
MMRVVIVALALCVIAASAQAGGKPGGLGTMGAPTAHAGKAAASTHRR